ncbi:unnamed protein product [Lathyrus sativus]|nr:unnamed protein product [Lathyrus sativus]
MTEVECAELPQEIIESISERLTIYSDYLRFRCVCRTWNYSVPKTPLHLPPQLPWLMLSHKSFFDLTANKLHLLDLPLSSSHATRICGSSFGWLVILNQISEVSLLNPITHITLSLPSLYTLPEFVRKHLDNNNNRFVNKVVLSSSPSHGDDFAAFAILNPNQLAFCRKSYDSWVLLRVNENHLWMDVVSKNGLFYAVSSEGMIAKCDVESSHVSIIKTTDSISLWNAIYYVVFSGEDMLLVYRYLQKENVSQTERFRILKLNWNVLKWEEIHTLGENTLFVGQKSCVSFCAADFVGCRPNCIYFVRKDDISVFSLSDKSIALLPHYPLNLDRQLGCSIWITPNLQ